MVSGVPFGSARVHANSNQSLLALEPAVTSAAVAVVDAEVVVVMPVLRVTVTAGPVSGESLFPRGIPPLWSI